MTFQTETDFSFIPIATTATTATKQTAKKHFVANVANVAGGSSGKGKQGQGSLSRMSRMSRRGESVKNIPSPLSILRRAGLVPVLAGDSFEVLGLENLPEDRREKCRQYCREHEREILQELRDEAWFRGGFHLAWFRNVGLDLAMDASGQVVWAVRKGWEKFWDVKQGALPTRSKRALPVDCEWQCWRYACKHHREILAALQPCKGWKPTGPGGGCATLEEFVNELEKERRRGVVTFCPFHDTWLLRKDCPKWCGRWNEPLTDEEREYWAALWPEKKPNVA